MAVARFNVLCILDFGQVISWLEFAIVFGNFVETFGSRLVFRPLTLFICCSTSIPLLVSIQTSLMPLSRNDFRSPGPSTLRPISRTVIPSSYHRLRRYTYPT